jgi:rhodanese-related sulfurtransferase
MEKTTFTRLSPAQAAALLPRTDLTILDTRDEATFDREHLAGATRLHSGNLDALILGTTRQRPVLIYCYHGHASVQYAKIFADFGFTEVYDLVGGYEAWRAYRAAMQTAPATPVPSPLLAAWMSEQGYTSGDINAIAANLSTPLMRAAQLGEVAIAEELIACGAALDPTNADGNNALWLACYSGNVRLVDLLIGRGIDIDKQNDNGATCLMYAASAGKTVIVLRLLDAGADISLKSLDDFTALDMAANIECLRLLRHASQRRQQPKAA